MFLFWYHLTTDSETGTSDVSGSRNTTLSSISSHQNDSLSTTPPKYSTHWPPTHHLNVLSSLEPPLKTSVASFGGSSGGISNGGGLSPPPSSLTSQSSAYSQLPTTTSGYSSSSSPSHASHHLPTHQTPTHHTSYRDHSDSYRSHHHHSTISSQVNIRAFFHIHIHIIIVSGIQKIELTF